MVALGSLEDISRILIPEKSNRLEINYQEGLDTTQLVKNIQKLEGISKVEKRLEEISLGKIYTKYFQEG